MLVDFEKSAKRKRKENHARFVFVLYSYHLGLFSTKILSGGLVGAPGRGMRKISVSRAGGPMEHLNSASRLNRTWYQGPKLQPASCCTVNLALQREQKTKTYTGLARLLKVGRRLYFYIRRLPDLKFFKLIAKKIF